MYRKDENGYNDTGKRRVSSLTGPSFGLNLITTLGQINYMDGAITKQVLLNKRKNMKFYLIIKIQDNLELVQHFLCF